MNAYPKGTYRGRKSTEWEFKSISTRASFTGPDRAQAYAEQLMAALPQVNEAVPF
jgi:hypothetical protein